MRLPLGGPKGFTGCHIPHSQQVHVAVRSFLKLVLRIPDGFSFFGTGLARYVDNSVEKFTTISLPVVRRTRSVLTATRALHQLAKLAAAF